MDALVAVDGDQCGRLLCHGFDRLSRSELERRKKLLMMFGLKHKRLFVLISPRQRPVAQQPG
jgi:hypothetical protein